MSMGKQERGVTLIELVIAIAVLAILLAAGLPSFTTWIQNTRTRTEANSILRGLQLARQEAIRNNARVNFSLTGGNGWRVGCVNVTTECPAVIQTRAASADVPVTIDAGGTTDYTFDNMGYLRVPVVAAGTAVTTIDVTNNTLAASDARNLRLTITSGGLIKMCDPKVTDGDDLRKCPA